MTSKECLEILVELTDLKELTNRGMIIKDVLEYQKQIEKDLEVLEILKEHFQVSEYGQWYIDMQESDFDFRSECSKEEWNNSPQKKIKEWLKND